MNDHNSGPADIFVTEPVVFPDRHNPEHNADVAADLAGIAASLEESKKAKVRFLAVPIVVEAEFA